MNIIRTLYRHPLALLTDLYELTMAYGYWKLGVGERDAAFHLFYRQNPFGSGYAVACGLETAMDFLADFHFDADSLDYLAGLEGNDGRPLFEPAFLDYLGTMEFSCDIDAVPEGTVVFAHEPMLRVTGPMLQAQIVETALLTIINFQSLIATKASRLTFAARGDAVLEFGLRRAQGPDGGVSASRAAYVGGCAATSNVLAGKLYGIPVRGTHAHSWVMFFEDEDEAFERYAEAMPNNCVFLVDTYDSLEGVRRAAKVGIALRERGHEMVGVRLDSGDLAYLSIEARKILDEAGFRDAAIVASNDLDEQLIASLKEQGAQIGLWGVGTKLATAYDQPALGGVYKLTAIRSEDGSDWIHKIKLSEQAIKISNPGLLQVRRFAEPGGLFLADAIYDTTVGISDPALIVDPKDMTRRKAMPATAEREDLLVPVLRAGQAVYPRPSLEAIRARVNTQLARFHPSIRRFFNPHEYPVGLDNRLHDLKTGLVMKARGLR